ncbi:hypothetical protein [Prosthecobacter sp.]|uniref:hypothetical protein n=1 Tax=Prosthecobacter sp. TaxID=1965333 RepID=UPI003783880E
MNESLTTHTTVMAEPVRRIKPAGMESTSSVSVLQPHVNAVSSSDIAQRVMRLTGSVRLARRTGQHWHLCGLNE